MSRRIMRQRSPRRLSPTAQNRGCLFEILEDRRLMSASIATPLLTLSPSATSNSAPSGYTPAQISHAYGFDQITFSGNIKADGAGQTIAIVDAYSHPNIVADLNTFDAQFGLPAPKAFTIVNQVGGVTLPRADAGWSSEIALDVEWAHAIAPGANILLVEANSDSDANLLAGVDYARRAQGVSAISLSWGGSEFSGETSSAYETHFTTPSGHNGVTFVAAAGDEGSTFGPEWPASSKNVLSVGGTTLKTSDTSGAYSSETVWNSTTGGASRYETEPTYQSIAQNTGRRTSPDVSYDANPSSGYAVYDSVGYQGTVGWQVVGGTSAGTPQWAALIAIANQGRALSGQSTLDGATATLPALYNLYATSTSPSYSTYTASFNDITTTLTTTTGGFGNRGFGFGGGSWSRGRGFRSIHANAATTTTITGAGYDTSTGLGTPKAGAVVSALLTAGVPNSSSTASAAKGSVKAAVKVASTKSGKVHKSDVVRATPTPSDPDTSSASTASIIGITASAATPAPAFPQVAPLALDRVGLDATTASIQAALRALAGGENGTGIAAVASSNADGGASASAGSALSGVIAESLALRGNDPSALFSSPSINGEAPGTAEHDLQPSSASFGQLLDLASSRGSQLAATVVDEVLHSVYTLPAAAIGSILFASWLADRADARRTKAAAARNVFNHLQRVTY
jgi:hypothetical protein